MKSQHTLGASVTVAGVGLHTNRRCRVSLHPAPVDHGRRIAPYDRPERSCAMTWAHRVPSIMSTSLAFAGGGTIRTIEHLMAALSAYGIDNVSIAVDGPEIPIFDGSARVWCRLLDRARVVEQPASRRVIRVLRTVQVERHKGFLRIEPASVSSLDMTYSLAPDFPVMRWAGAVERGRFVAELSRSRSFGIVDWRKRLGWPPARRDPFPGQPVVEPHAPDPAWPAANHQALVDRLDAANAARDPAAPLLRGARPGRAALVVGRAVLPWPRYRDEPVRHVALDMIGDLALAGAPLLGRLVAHNPSHEKTYLLVAALMESRAAWTIDTVPATDGAPASPR